MHFFHNLENSTSKVSSIEFQSIDNLLPAGFANFLELELLNMNNWLYIDSASGIYNQYELTNKNIVDSCQFSHMIYDFEYKISSPLWEHVKPMLWFLEDRTGYKILEIGRIKANLLLPNNTQKNNYNPPHVDTDIAGYTSMVYYVNESDGDTRLFDKYLEDTHVDLTMTTSNTPEKGSAILFPSTQYHCSSNPINYKTRIVINFVLKLAKF